MKKIIIAITFICLGIAANAQVYDVVQGSSHPFSVSVTSGTVAATGFSWSADAALGATFTSANTASTSVTFGGAVNSTGDISVSAVSSGTGACPSDARTRSFRIVSELSITAVLPSIADICPVTTTNSTGGDIPAFTIEFRDLSNNPVNVNSFTYQIITPANVVGAEITSDPVGGASTATLDIATAYTNSQTGSYTIRIVSITPAVGNAVTYPDASGNYPNTTVAVNVAPVITW